ncbi:hypothetical protein QBC42DRAFT_326481 [Cladorrhinum samala]|uniref:Rhodopsin domain-containing protein n=1 Tax=Cladorrhinum samala TaxID=585594 RepID=A0AAV9HSM5_9PEZI|nr:hypothetical protein QBC42DRAFT_326481 [Cladorrhinum samala]
MPAIAIPTAATAEVYHRLAARDLMPGTNQASVFIVGIVFSVIAIAVMGLRVYCRIVITKGGLGTDDYLMLAGVLCNIGLSIANMVCAWYGAGVHMTSRTQEEWLANYPGLFQSNYANRLLYVVAMCLVKTSLLVFYLRVDPRKWTKYAIYFLIFTVIGLSVATALICIFECWPPRLYWDVTAQLTGATVGKCMDPKSRQTFFEANGIINIVQDACIYLLPVPMLWRLQVPRRQKAGLLFLFCIGFVALAAACVRYHYVLKLANSDDIWYYFADSLNWCSIEVYAAVICGSASTFRVLFKTYAPRLWGSSRYGFSGGVNGAAKHPYVQSGSGSFALRTFGQGDDKSKKPKHELTALDSNSEEAIVPRGSGQSTRHNNGIVMNNEFHMEVRTASRHSDGADKKFVVPESLKG